MRWGVVLACTLATAHARADDATTSVRLADVIAAAPHAPAMQVARHEIDAATALVDAAGAWPNPAIRVETNRLTARLVTGVTLPLPVFGTVGAARRVAEAQRDAVQAAAIVDHRDIVRRAVIAWIALARTDGELAAATTAATQAAELERIARGRLDAGAGSEVDVTTSRAAHARATLAAATAHRAQEAASAELAGIVGWNPTRPLAAAGDLPGRDAAAIDRLRAEVVRHPAHELAERRVVAADAAVEQVGSQYWPSVALEGQVAIDDPTTPGTDAFVALSLELPVFAHVGDRSRSTRASLAAERARLTATATQLDAELVAAYHRWQSATERLTALETEIVAAQERAQKQAHQAYREGALGLAAALQTDRDLAAVHAEVVAARADLATAWVTLEDAAGHELRASDAP